MTLGVYILVVVGCFHASIFGAIDRTISGWTGPVSLAILLVYISVRHRVLSKQEMKVNRPCRACGYELAGLGKDIYTCPECGKVFDPDEPLL